MPDLKRDPVWNVIEDGIKGDIAFNLENGRLRSTVLLTYSGMDAMAYLSMPPGETEVTRTEFISWCDRYIRFPCKEQIPGVDFYGARCGMLHNYGPVSRLSTDGKCRMIGYMDQSVPEVRFDATSSANLVLVSVSALKEAFFKGLDQCLMDIFTDKNRAAAAEARFRWLVHSFEAKPTP